MSSRSSVALVSFALLGQADAFAPCALGCARSGSVLRATSFCKLGEPSPPLGFVWADNADSSAADSRSSNGSDLEGGVVPTKASVVPAETNANVVPTETKVPPKKAKSKVVSPRGIFAPLVLGAKSVLGDKELNALRGDIILKHSKVISAFIDTSESKFGQLVLRRMFDYADKDGNGTLDRAEVEAALVDLGFDFLNDKQLSTIMDRADDDKNEVIDFEEFVQETPRTLRVGLVKLAKKNGHDLGFLA